MQVCEQIGGPGAAAEAHAGRGLGHAGEHAGRNTVAGDVGEVGDEA